jgi:hypothetical protein
MKCIYCSTDSKYRERTDGTCKACHRPFAFEPTKMDKKGVITDMAFQGAINAASDLPPYTFTTNPRKRE